MLQFCGVLRRPLTISEFRELLSVNTRQDSRDVGQMIHDICDIVADTRGLIYVDEEEQTVHYVHQSVRNHLFDSGSLHGRLSTTDLDLHLGFLVLVYLNFSDFRRSLVKVDGGSNLRYGPIDIAVASFGSSSNHTLRVTAQKLLRSRRSQQQVEGTDLKHRIRQTVGTVELS